MKKINNTFNNEKIIFLLILSILVFFIRCQKETNIKIDTKNPKPIFSLGQYDWSIFFESSYINEYFGTNQFIDSVENIINYDPRELANNSLYKSWLDDIIIIDSTINTIAKNYEYGRETFWSIYQSELNDYKNDMFQGDTLEAYQHLENFSSLLDGQQMKIIHFYTVDENQQVIDNQFTVYDPDGGYHAKIHTMKLKFDSLKGSEPFNNLSYSKMGLLFATGFAFMMMDEEGPCEKAWNYDMGNAGTQYQNELDYCDNLPHSEIDICADEATFCFVIAGNSINAQYWSCKGGNIYFNNNQFNMGRLILPSID